MYSAAKVKSFNLPFWGPCLKWIKESNKISFQTFNFPARRHSPSHSEMTEALSHLLLPMKYFPRLSLLIALLLFLYRRKRKKERKRRQKKKISWPPACTALFTGPLLSLGDPAKKKLHLADNNHFSLNPQFKHDPEWKIAKQEACKLPQSNVINMGVKDPLRCWLLGWDLEFYRRNLGLCGQGSCGNWLLFVELHRSWRCMCLTLQNPSSFERWNCCLKVGWPRVLICQQGQSHIMPVVPE